MEQGALKEFDKAKGNKGPSFWYIIKLTRPQAEGDCFCCCVKSIDEVFKGS